jgi:hypothetical protein
MLIAKMLNEMLNAKMLNAKWMLNAKMLNAKMDACLL